MPKIKITDEDIEQIHALHEQGVRPRVLAIDFGVSISTIRQIVSGSYARKERVVDESYNYVSSMDRLYEICRKVKADGYGVDYGRWMADHRKIKKKGVVKNRQ